MNKVRIIKIIVIVFLIISIIIFGIFDINLFSNSKYNGVKGKRVDGLIFQENGYTYDPNQGGILTVNIINTTDDLLMIDGIKVNYKDNNDKIIETLNTKIYLELESYEQIEYTFYFKNFIDIINNDLEYIPNILKGSLSNNVDR